MAVILYRFADGHREKVEVTEEFATQYAEMEHKDALIERKETRRHQSLDKSMEHGFDVPDPQANVFEEIERRELLLYVHNNTQEALAFDRDCCTEYIRRLNKELCVFLLNYFKGEN